MSGRRRVPLDGMGVGLVPRLCDDDLDGTITTCRTGSKASTVKLQTAMLHAGQQSEKHLHVTCDWRSDVFPEHAVQAAGKKSQLRVKFQHRLPLLKCKMFTLLLLFSFRNANTQTKKPSLGFENM